MDLDEASKERIRLEETYRVEMRAALAEKQAEKKRKSLWDWINAPITLWALSSVVVGLLGAAYTAYSEKQKTQAAEILRIERLIQEAASRVDSMFFVLRQAKSASVPAEAMVEQLMSAPGLFPEYANRDYRSLVWEMDILCPSSDSVQEIKRLLGDIREDVPRLPTSSQQYDQAYSAIESSEYWLRRLLHRESAGSISCRRA